jgi:hypothetical protein
MNNNELDQCKAEQDDGSQDDDGAPDGYQGENW